MNEIKKEHILAAIKEIDKEGIRSGRHSSTYDLIHESKPYPPKLVISIANRYATGGELDSSIFSGGVDTPAFQLLKKEGFDIVSKRNDIHDLITKYKKHILQTHLKDEKYKWELLHKFHGKPNLDAPDLLSEIKSIKFNNLIYAMGVAVINHLVKDKPEEMRSLFKSLFDENSDLTTRIKAFNTDSLKIYRSLGETLSHHQDERTIASYLTFYNPKKYTFYKYSFYKKLCGLLNEKEAKKNEKYPHYLLLINRIIEEYIKNDSELIEIVKSFIPEYYDGSNNLLLAQDILYQMLDNNQEVNEINVKEDFIDWMIANISGGNYFANQFGSKRERLNEEFSSYEEKYKSEFNTELFIVKDEKYEKLIEEVSSNIYNTTTSFNNYSKEHFSGRPTAILGKKQYLAFLKEHFLHKENDSTNETINAEKMNFPLNQILYGAPGTGKTYNSKRLAVEIIDGLDYSKSDRNTILERYEQLYKSKQINFTTFHQSISYEDFIEGIKPVLKSDDDESEEAAIKKDTIEYEIKDGLFKNLCRLAEGVSGKIEVVENFDFQNRNFYKMSLGGKHKLEKHNWSIKNNLVFLGWGGDKDFTKLKDIKDWRTFRDTFKKEFPDLVEESKFVIQAVYSFQKMDIGDVVVITKGNNILDAIGIIESEYFYDDSQEIDHYQFRKVKWLATNMNASPQLFIDKNISQQTVYKFYNDDVKIDVFNENFKKENKKTEHKKYVLIIDEINRGNISSIFGELITLLEDDKRKGILKENKEAIEVELPYSDDKFSVPDNLYIIGTMNTADRSVESLDTALRRRFSFVEMQPDLNVLEQEHPTNGIISINCDNVDMVKMLDKINKRIDILIDKDHKIGHSFFINILSFTELQLVFKDKIIPLLEEYFFGDFGKIGLVLGESFIKNTNTDKKDIFAKFDDYEDRSLLTDKLVYDINNPMKIGAEHFISIYE